MNRILNVFLFTIFLFSCGEQQQDCNEEWERNTLVSNDFFDWEWKCVPKLNLYTNHGNWNAQVNVIDHSGNEYFYDLNNLNSHNHDLKYITLDYPQNFMQYSSNNESYPNSRVFDITLEFINSTNLEFIINDTVFDPHLESYVFYSGSGQIIHTNGSADAVIEFNCDYSLDNMNYKIFFDSSRYN